MSRILRMVLQLPWTLVPAITLLGMSESGWGFPRDFPVLRDTGGLGYGQRLTGFGGNEKLDRAGNRKKVKHVPIILLHGNGASATDPNWGMGRIRDYLFDAGYNPSEVWAVSYLGENNAYAEMTNVVTLNIEDVRSFIDAVREYLDVEKVDVLGHSLGATMARAYMKGLEPTGWFNPANERFDAISTYVSLAGAHAGLSTMSGCNEFFPGGPFMMALNSMGGVIDQTPYGASDSADQLGYYPSVTSYDNDQVTYVALRAIGDAVELQNPGTGLMLGAHLNRGYALGAGIIGHMQIIFDRGVFNDFLPYLNQKQ